MASRSVLLLALLLLLGSSAANHYAELGVRRTASQEEIKAAYRQLARQNHPDKNKGGDAQARFQRIANAYETLSDPEKRRMYDMYGDDYATIGRQKEQQRQFRAQFHDPFRRGRSNVPPIFSLTPSVTTENHYELIENSADIWLLLFYHDWSEPCKEFAPKWEALAQKLPPMVRLARVNIDHNFGMLQRYRQFMRCRQLAFSLGVECNAPALVLLTPDRDGESVGEAYHGALQAEHIYEWLKRSFVTRTNPIQEVKPTRTHITRFLSEISDRRKRRRSERARQPPSALMNPKVLVMSASRVAGDTLFSRYLESRFPQIDIGTLHVEGGIDAANAAAAFAREVGVTQLPSLVLWPDGIDTVGPIVMKVGSSSEAEQRVRLLESLHKHAIQSVPSLTAANYHGKCSPPVTDPRAQKLCVILIVPANSIWSETVSHAYSVMRALALPKELNGVEFAWVDSDRHKNFAQALRSRGASFAGSPPSIDEPLLVALKPARANTGLRSVNVAHMAVNLRQLSKEQLRAWVGDITTRNSRAWGAARQLPPLAGNYPPSILSRWSSWILRGGWLFIGALVAVAILLFVYGESIIKWAKTERRRRWERSRAQGQRARPQATPSQTPAGQPQTSAESSQQASPREAETREPSSSNPSNGGARERQALPPGVVVLTERNMDDVLGGSANVLLFAINAGMVDRATMYALIRHFADRNRDNTDFLRQWTLAVLDVSEALRVEQKTGLLRSLLGSLKTSPCAVVRHGRKLSAYFGTASPWKVDEWLARLTMGELTWETLV